MRLDAQVRSSGDVEGRLAAVGDNRDRVGGGAAAGEKDSFCSKFITSEVERQLTEGEGNNIIDRGDQDRRRRRSRGRDRGPKHQMAPSRRKEQQQQQVSSVGGGAHQTTASLIESLSVQGAGSGADQMASLAQMSSYLMNSFHNNQQQQQTFSQQAPQVQSPLNGFMSAAALASVAAARHHQQQQQQRDLLLSQFASLHSLSAVASAIQQQHQNQQSSNFNLVDNQSPSFSSCLSERLAQSLAGSNQQHAHQPPYHVGGGMHQATSGPAPGGGVPFPAGFASIPPSTLVSSLGTSTSSAQYQQQPGARHLRPRRRGARKCRKMYGMAQRQLWCTQCKWKKACSRFLAQMVNGNHQVAVSSSTSS